MQKIISLFIIIFCSKLVFAKTDSIPAIHIIEKPISYSEERKKLSVEYLQNRHGLNITKPIITPKITKITQY